MFPKLCALQGHGGLLNHDTFNRVFREFSKMTTERREVLRQSHGVTDPFAERTGILTCVSIDGNKKAVNGLAGRDRDGKREGIMVSSHLCSDDAH